MTKRQKVDLSKLNSVLKRCHTEDQKTFTKTLKDMEKDWGGSYCNMGKEGVKVFRECAKIFKESKNSVVQYNALRLAKYTVSSPNALGDSYREPWEIYLKTMFNPDGRVRMAGVHLLDRYYFGLSFDLSPIDMWQGKKRKTDPKTMEEVSRFVIEKFLYLQKMEENYMKEYEEHLKYDDLPDIAGRVPWASDTKDKYLKSIRMGLEVFYTRGPLEDLMQRYGYREKTSKEFPDMSIFQRYEEVMENETSLNHDRKTYIMRVKMQHEKHICRDIEISADMTLYHVAKAILDSFDFDFDHLFEFGNSPDVYDSDIRYELKTEDDLVSPYEESRAGDVEEVSISKVPFFRKPKDKMYFLFDYGDNWHFEIELLDFGKTKKDNMYPQVININGIAPSQYGEAGGEDW